MSLRRDDFFLNRFDVKLTLTHTSVLLLITIALSVFFYYELKHHLLSQVDHFLEDEVNELITEIREDADILAGCRNFADDISQRKISPLFFRVLRQDGTGIWADSFFANVRIKSAGARVYYSITAEGAPPERFRVYENRFDIEPVGAFIVQIATGSGYADTILEKSLLYLLGAFPVVLALSLMGGFYIAQRPRRILKQLSTATNAITSKKLGLRLPLPLVRDEIHDLTLTINSMLDRIEKGFDEIKHFTADVSHELRTPLSVLKGEIEVAISQPRAAGEYEETLYYCLERVERMIKMVNDLLIISRFDAQNYDFQGSPVNLSELLREIHEFFLPLAQEKQIEFTIASCADVACVIDRPKMMRLLSNLIDNAIKFTPSGGSVSLMLKKEDASVKIHVRDNGIGIPEGEMENIFKRFYKVDSARTNNESGAGLGLHICRQIAEIHGGTLTAGNNPGGGAILTLTLPAQACTVAL